MSLLIQADTFTDMLNEEYEDEITEILERAVNMGVMMIFGIHASKFRGYDELTSWIKSTNHGLVLGRSGKCGNFPGSLSGENRIYKRFVI